ncbi:beta-glucosidase [Sphingosinicellaceae bacterium]|nr:beta-glucosidase [Sphingosinicellaceae bacterium]
MSDYPLVASSSSAAAQPSAASPPLFGSKRAALLALTLLLAGTAASALTLRWQDRTLAPEARAEALVAAMTRAEKLQLIRGYFPPLAKEPKPGGMIPSAGHVPGIPRLGIPNLKESDASLGVANQIEQRKGDVATALPAGLATAATFDPEIAYAGGAMIGAEARAKTFNVLLAGGVNLTRDPWNGRNFEYLGEDPLLAGTLAGAAIRGVESNHIVSTIKHFALNSQETGRMVLDARIDPAALRESDLLAFQIAIEHGKPGSVMCAYNKVAGDYACENAPLLNDVLKRDWGYRGWVMSDWGAVHSTVKAAMSGLDQESGQELDKQIFFAKPFETALASGAIPAKRLDDMVERILYGVIASGLMDDPTPTAPQRIDYATHAKVAQRTAEAGIVLLKNDGGLLPLARTARKILLVGGHADVGVLSGGGSSQVRSVGGAPVEIPLTSGAAMSFARVTWHASSPLKAFRALLPGATVSYIDGRDPAAAAAAAKGADLVVVFATQWQTEAMDTATIDLPDNQDALIAKVTASNRRTLVVLETGGPVTMPWLADVPAVIEAWYPGQRGGEAIARIVLGDVNPGGRLPITFPESAKQAPRPVAVGLAELAKIDAAATSKDFGMNSGLASFPVDYPEGADVGYRWYQLKDRKPLFPFGYGLTYTSFGYKALKVTDGAALSVSFDVTNTGKVAGTDVPQLYVEATGSGGTTTRRLAGWGRVTLAPGETRRVTVAVDPRTIARFDAAAHGWRLAAGSYRLSVGRHAGDAVLSGVAKLDAKQLAAGEPWCAPK